MAWSGRVGPASVTGGHLGDVEQFLEEMFRAGMVEVYARMVKFEAFGPGTANS